MRVAMIGLGLMGTAMARRLLAHNFEVTVYNRTQAKADRLASESPRVTVAVSPAAAVRASDVALSMVADDNALNAVSWGADGILAGLKPRQVWVDFSTVSIDISRKLANEASAKGAARLEAPVGGSVNAAESGTLTIWLGGDPDQVPTVSPILQALSTHYEYIGPTGQALALKLAINLNLGIQVLAFAEGLLLAQKAGISADRALSLMENSSIASPALKYRAPWMLTIPDTPWFRLDLMAKDIELALAYADHPDLVPLSASLAHTLRQARQEGWGHDELASVYQFLRDRWARHETSTL